MGTSVREPAVAGRFYPGNKTELKKLIEKIHKLEKKKIDLSFADKNIFGAVVPHAGYMFSAYQAVHFFNMLSKRKECFDTFIIINPNHTGYGEAIALESHKYWQTPFGFVETDREFTDKLGFPVSDIAHQNEHSGEVMLPLLQHFVSYDFKIVPITLSNQTVGNAKLLANKINEVKQVLNREICIIASSDFSHFLSPDKGMQLDQLVLDQIENKDIQGVYNVVSENKISVCGFGPIISLMEYSKLQNTNYKSKIMARGHSGEIIPSNEVVDYISILFYGE
ncbi:MAG: AmmeMemoRadiSam system protein B [Bacteroidetes bacterium 4572_117]|nr:MAG: AmmeMemoRadiSam system protein B [Bacteroidetes bacterium 4572_117]